MRGRSRLARAVLRTGLSVLMSACGDMLSLPPPGPPTPTIEMRLVSGAAEQFASVSYTAPAESTILLALRPVSPDSVALVIVSPEGTGVPLLPIPERPGIYRATFTPLPGATYRLTGVVAGRDVAAQVTTPGPVVVDEPHEDTLRASFQASTPQVPYALHSAGSRTYAVVFSKFLPKEDTTLTQGYGLRDSVGLMQLWAFSLRADTTQFVIWAFDTTFSSFSDRGETGPALGNVRGVLGTFTAVTLSKPKTIVWQ